MKKVLVIVGNSSRFNFLERVASTLASSGFELMITSSGLGIEVMDKVSLDVAIVKDNPSSSV